MWQPLPQPQQQLPSLATRLVATAQGILYILRGLEIKTLNVMI